MSSGPPARVVALVLAVALLLPLGTGAVLADGSVSGASDTIVVDEGETVDDVDGVAGTIIVRGTVTGDVSGAAGTVHVTETGRVEDDVEAAAGTVRVDGTVGDDVDAAGGSVEVSESGRVGGDLQVGGGHVEIDGRVDGSVTAGVDRLELGPNAVVGDEVRHDAETVSIHPDATVRGAVVEDSSIGGSEGAIRFDPGVPSWLWTGYGVVANLLLGVVLLALFPAFSSRVADRVAEEPVVAGGAGLLTAIAVPIALVAFALTIVGIPLTVIGAIGFGIALWVAAVYGQFAVGSRLVAAFDHDDRWLALVVGVVGFALVGAVPLVGNVAEAVAAVLGLGALAMGLRDVYGGDDDGSAGDRQATLDETPRDAAS